MEKTAQKIGSTDKTDKIDREYRKLERAMFDAVNHLTDTINSLQIFCAQNDNMEFAHRLADTRSEINRLFGMGLYHEFSGKIDLAIREKDVAATAEIMQKLIDHCETIMDFNKSSFFTHTNFRRATDGQCRQYYDDLRADLIKDFCNKKHYGYMQGNSFWESLRKKAKDLGYIKRG